MDTFLNWLSANPIITNILVGALIIIVLSLGVMFVIAFRQGREISFYPPKIGSKPNTTEQNDKKAIDTRIENSRATNTISIRGEIKKNNNLTAKYVCTNNPNHVFSEMTGDGFCPEPECYGIGFLVEIQTDIHMYICSNNPNHIFNKMTADGFCPEPECYGVGFLIKAQNYIKKREIGLCILLMDISNAMKLSMSQNNPITKSQLIAGSISSGIFELGKMTSSQDVYIIGIAFDSETHHLFTNSVSEIINIYRNPSILAKFLLDHFTYGNADINKAIKLAKQIYDDFIQYEDLSKYGGPKNVTPLRQTILTQNGNTEIVPNVRVVIYTNGEDNTTGYIKKNPFTEGINILSAAFIGHDEDAGFTILKNFVSKCPIHGVKQVFLINNDNRIPILKRWFRMASGASGFCPVCLNLEN